MLTKIYSRIKGWLAWLVMGGVVLAATALPQTASIQELIVLEDTYYAKHGKYLQIIPDDRLPHYEAGSVVEKLGKHAPPQATVHIYEQADRQKGYQIVYNTPTSTNSIGFGPQAAERTFVIPEPQGVASSTPISLWNGKTGRSWLVALFGVDYAYAITKSANLVRASTQYFSATDSASLSITGNLTVEAWVRLTSLPADGEIYAIVSKGNLAGVAGAWGLFRVQNVGGVYSLHAYLSTGGTTSNSLVSWTPSTNTWYHLAMAYDTGGNVKFYLDGVQQGTTQTGAVTSLGDDNGVTAIGKYDLNGTPSGLFNGDISLVRLWSTNRTEAQINDNKCTVLGSTANLAAEWTLDDVLTDNSGNSNTLTNNNAATFTTALPSCFAAATIGEEIINVWEE